MATSVTLNPAVTNVTVASPSAISVDLTTFTTTVNVTSGLLPQDLGTSAIPSFYGLNITTFGGGINFTSGLSTRSGKITFEDNKENAFQFYSKDNGNLVAYQTFDSTDAAEKVKFHKDVEIEGTATAVEFVGDLRGAVRFQAKAGESLAKGDVVYISSVSGQKPVVSKAQANSAATMPSFGLANAAVSANGNIEVISFGTFAHGDTTGGAEEWEFGDILYVSAATAGALTNVKPAGAANLIQNVGKVERVHAQTGSIMVAGAGRTAATPNLDTGKFFIGDSNNYSSIGSFNNQFTNTSGTISLNGANITASTVTVTDSTANTDFPVVFHDESNGLLDDTGALTYNPSTGALVSSGTITASPTMQLITGSTTSVNTTDFLSYAGKRLMVTTSGALTIDLPNSVAADAGKTWVIMNASNNEMTLDVDNNGTTQYFRILTGGSVITPYLGQSVSHLKITKGGIAELVCLGAGNDISAPSYLIFGSGVHYE